jgi:outer membrane protein TolC
MKRTSTAVLLGCVLAALPLRAQDAPRALTLEQAIALALESNPGLKAVRERVEEAERRSRVVFSNYLPRLRTQGGFMGTDNQRGILIPAGALGTVPGLGSFPPTEQSVQPGGNNLTFALTTLAQPLSPIFKVREGLGVTRADESVSRAELRRTEQMVTMGVIRAYAGVLISQLRGQVARERVAAAELRSTIQRTAVQSGVATSVAETEARLRALQSRQELMEAEHELIDLNYKLADVLGLPSGTVVAVQMPALAPPGDATVEQYTAIALRSSPDILEAEALVTKAHHGVRAARTEFIPDIALFGAHFYQSSIAFFPRSTMFFGAMGSWTLLDFGARRNTLAERSAQRRAAEGNLARVQGNVRGEVQAAYRKVARAREMAALAREALALRTEALRLRTASTTAGYGVPAEQREANADKLDAELGVLRAEFGLSLAQLELEMAAGTLGRNP